MRAYRVVKFKVHLDLGLLSQRVLFRGRRVVLGIFAGVSSLVDSVMLHDVDTVDQRDVQLAANSTLRVTSLKLWTYLWLMLIKIIGSLRL